MVIDLIEIPCAELPCPSGGLSRVSEVAVGAGGAFTATMVTRSTHGGPDGTLESPDYRIIVATEHGVAWDVGTPHVRVSPITHAGVPGPPNVGNSIGPTRAWWLPGLLLIGFSAVVAFATRRIIRASG